MITEDYVSFEVAKLLKEKGFNDHNISYGYDEYGKVCEPIVGVCEPVVGWRKVDPFYLRPTHQMAMRWLRDNYSLHPFAAPSVVDGFFTDKYHSYVDELKKKYPFSIFVGTFDSYEQAVEEAIKYCLENLI